MSVNSSFTLCPQAQSAFSSLPEANGRKLPSLLVRSLQRGTSPESNSATTTQSSSRRLLRGTFPNLRERASEQTPSSATPGAAPAAAVRAYSPFEALVNERNMNRGPISPLSQEEFQAWKQAQQKQAATAVVASLSSGGHSETHHYQSISNATVDWEEGPTENGEELGVPDAYQKRRAQLQVRERILQVSKSTTNTNTASRDEKQRPTTSNNKDIDHATAFKAPRAIRATPFEPLVHQRNLKDGILSPFLLDEYSAWNGGQSIVTYLDPPSASAAKNNSNGDGSEEVWKRRYQRAEVARFESRKQTLGMAEANRQLKIELIHQQAAQLSSAFTDTNPTESSSNPRKRAHASTRQEEDPKGASIATDNGEHDERMSETDGASKQQEEEVTTAGDVHSLPMMKDQDDTTITECDEGDNDEKPSFINLKRGGGRGVKLQESLMCDDDANFASSEASAVHPFGDGENHKDLIEQRDASKEERDDSALLGSWDRFDTSNLTDDSSHKRRRLSFDVEPIMRGKLAYLATMRREEEIKSTASPPGSLLLDTSMASKSGCDVLVEGGDTSLSALDVSAITSSSPTPVKCDRADTTSEDEPNIHQNIMSAPAKPTGFKAEVANQNHSEQHDATVDIGVDDHQSVIDLDSNAEAHNDSKAPGNQEEQASAADTLPEEAARPSQDHNLPEKPKGAKASKRNKKTRRKRTPMKGLLKPSQTSPGPNRVTRSRSRKSIETAEKPTIDSPSLDEEMNHIADSCFPPEHEEGESGNGTNDQSNDVPMQTSTVSCVPEQLESDVKDLSPVGAIDGGECGKIHVSSFTEDTAVEDNASDTENQVEKPNRKAPTKRNIARADLKMTKTRPKPTKEENDSEDIDPLALSLGSKASNACQQGGKKRGRRRRGTLVAALQAPALKKNRRQKR